jgi:hypothetical protein
MDNNTPSPSAPIPKRPEHHEYVEEYEVDHIDESHANYDAEETNAKEASRDDS